MAKKRGIGVPLKFEIDEKLLKRAEDGFEDIGGAVKQLDKSLDKVADTAKGTSRALASVGDKGIQDLKEYSGELKNVQRQMALLQKGQRQEAYGTVSTGTSAIGGLLGGLGLGPLQEAVMLVSDLTGALEQLPNLAEGVDALSGAASTGTTAVAEMAVAEAGAGTSATAATPGILGFSGSIWALLGPLALVAAAVAAVAIAFKAATEKIKEGGEAVAGALDAQRLYFETIETGSIESVKAAIAQRESQLRVERQMLETAKAAYEAVGALGQLVDWLGGNNLKKTINESEDNIRNLNMEIDALNKALNSGELASEGSAEATKDLTSAQQAATEAVQKQAAAQEEARRKEEERTRAIQQFAKDVSQARMREAQAEASAAQKRTNKLMDIARQYANAVQDAGRTLETDLASMAEKYGQTRADIIENAHLEEAKATRAHLQNMERLRQQNADDEFNAARDRDFAKLADIRRNAEKQVEAEADRFSEERKEANKALRLRLRDAAKSYMQERQQRQRDYANQLRDLKIARVRQTTEARIAYNRELSDLRRKLRDEVALKRAALDDTLRATRRWAGQMRSAVGGGSTTTAGSGMLVPSTGGKMRLVRRAAGGPLAAGQSAMVNEMGTESFMSGGSRSMFPNGLGIFTPLRSGTVQSAGGPAINMTVYAAPGMSEAKVAQIAVQKIGEKLEAIFK